MSEKEERTCRECGCSHFDPCIHEEFGSCWWVEEDLCSHCVEVPGESERIKADDFFKNLEPLFDPPEGDLHIIISNETAERMISDTEKAEDE